MKILNTNIRKISSVKFFLFYFFYLFFILSCKSDKNNVSEHSSKSENENIIEIITEDMDFQMPDTITSGWNTFRYKNLSNQTHFFLVDKYPEGKTSEDAKNLVAPVFDKAMALIMEGNVEEGFAEFSNLPDWFGDVQFVGGSGLLSPNKIGDTTINLEPGKYILECYVKMSNGIFHTSMGMTKDIVVTNINSGMEEPVSDISIQISSEEGIVINDSIIKGKHRFSVYFKDQKKYEHFLGHDVNLVKLSKNANLSELESWMNWADPKGLIEPAPSGITFLGGVNDLPAGNKGYFTASIEQGNYALISELPNASSKNMLITFTVD